MEKPMANTNPVVALLADGLASNGYSGLCTRDRACRCRISNLVECNGDPTLCEPGYVAANPDQPTDWTVLPGLPPNTLVSEPASGRSVAP